MKTNYGEQQQDRDDIKSYGFLQRQAMRLARWPKTHFWVAFVATLGLSVVGFVVGNFSVSAEHAGWESRGTLIANRQTQLMLTIANQDYLAVGGSAAWDDLLNNVQPGWHEDYDYDEDGNSEDSKRLLEAQWTDHKDGEEVRLVATSLKEAHRSKSIFKRYENHRDLLGLFMSRRLQEEKQNGDGKLERCDIEWYIDGRMVNDTRLWPIWKTRKSTSSALDADVLKDLCISEEETQMFLEENGLCFGCEEGCLPPYSVVLYARLIVPGGLSMDCHSLAEAWSSGYQLQIEENWKLCAEDLDETGLTADFPESCDDMFYPSLLDKFFLMTRRIQYTSSIFATTDEMVYDLYDNVDNFSKGTDLVEGAYDTQYEHFVGIFAENSVGQDMLLALISAVVTACAILIHTRSPFLTLVGLIQIILSFPVAYFVYTLLGQLNFFPFLNFIGVFVVFALGADHIFVAVDKWKNARIELPSATTEEIAATALPDAASAMFLTTSTTAVAFFGTAICPVAPVKLFAIFCGLLIVFDYIMDVLLVFPCLCIYDSANHSKITCSVSCCTKTVNKDDKGSRQTLGADDDNEEEGGGTISLIRRILSAYYQFLHLCRWPLLVASIASLCVCIYFSTTLELPTTSDVRLLSSEIEYERAFEWRSNLLIGALEKRGGSQAYVIWGTKPADTGDHNNPNSWSQLVMDDSFDPSPQESQKYLRDFCPKLFSEDFAGRIQADYECPINRFDSWLQHQSNSSSPDVSYVTHCAGSTGLPIAEHIFHPCLVAWTDHQGETSILSQDGVVKIMFFPFMSRVRYDSPNSELDTEWHLIESWMDTTLSQTAPAEVSKAFFSSMDFWWYDTNSMMFKTAFGSAAIAIAASAIVILLSSRSLVMTLFSVVSVAYVLASVTALMTAIGWTLGFLESICFAILIGVSVDFVIHFSHAYASLPGEVSRHERTKFALVHMGPSILAAAVTTLAGAIVMLFTVITFFQKFALVLFLTIIQATVGSFIVFLTLTDCIGPINPTYLMDHITKRVSSLKIGEQTSMDTSQQRQSNSSESDEQDVHVY